MEGLDTMSIIRLEGMHFYAHHGCFEEERVIGTRFIVDVALSVDTTLAEHSDSLDDTVNYAEVYQVVKKEMQISSKLLEHVAHRIGEALLEPFPLLRSVTIKISKMAPPLGGKMTAASVEVCVLKEC